MRQEPTKSWLRKRAKQLRLEMTPQEMTMWQLLHDGELVSLNWRKQPAFGDYILDFVSHPARLIIEVDGSQHAQAEQAQYDDERSTWFASQGYRVLRFWNNDVVNAKDGVWRAIQAAAARTPAHSRMERWRRDHMAQIAETNARITSSSMEEVAAKRPEEVRARSIRKEPPEAHPATPLASPPQSALRADSSSIEEEQI
jgi:very-short-patch-repair endonuclease